jgi:CrcB protein
MNVIWIYIALGGFGGAVSRYAITKLMATRFPSAFPYGTLTVNIVGSFALGWLAGSNMAHDHTYTYAALGVGYLGAFTTFSTYAVESLHMTQKKQWRIMIIYQLTSYGISIGAVALGFLVGKSMN